MANNTEVKNVQLNINGNAQQTFEALKRQARQLAEQLGKALEIGDSASVKKLRSQYHQVLTEIGQITTKQEQFRQSLKNMDLVDMKELLRLQKQIQQVMLSGHVRKGSQEWKEYERQLGQVNNRLAKMKTEMSAAGQGWLSKLFSGATGNAGFGAIAGGVGKLAGAFGLAMTAGQAFVRVMKDLVAVNMQFEQQQANLASVLGKSRSEIAELTKQAKLLGDTTLYSASEVSGLQINLAKLGFSESEIKQSTRPILDFALATGAQLPEAAAVAGAALRAFGLDASQMERVVSTMAVATTKSALDFEKLRTSISITFPVAKAFGFSIEDTVTLLAKLSDAGFEASSAATATRNILLNMANPAGRLAKALGRPITNVNELGTALAELKERNISLAEAFALTDKRSVAAFTRFVEASGQLEQFKESITDADQGLRDMVEERMNTLQSSVTLLESAWQGLMLTFSNSTGVFKSITDRVTDLVHWMTRLFSTIPENVDRDVATAVNDRVTANKSQWAEEFKRSYEGTGSHTLEGALKNQMDTVAKYAKLQEDAAQRVRDLYAAKRMGLGTAKAIELVGEMNIEQMESELDMLTRSMINYGVEMEKAQYFVDRINSTLNPDNKKDPFDKDAMKKQRAAIELRIKQLQKAEEDRYLNEDKARFDDMTYEEQEEADKKHWERMYQIEIEGYREISKLYTGNNDQLEASFEGRAVVSERKLADKLFAITQQYAAKDEKAAMEREKMRIKTGRETLAAAKANATAQANYEYEQFVLSGGRKDDAARKLRASLLQIDQDYFQKLHNLYAADITEDQLSKKTKAKLREQYDAEALRALAERTKKESEFNKRITDEVLKSEEELRKMGDQFDKQNKLNIFGDADAKLAEKRYELDNMLLLYDDYFQNLLASENLTAEERARIEQLYSNKVKQINERLKDWEGMNARERYKAVVEVVDKCLDEVKSLYGSITSYIGQKYDTQKAMVEARYDKEIEAAKRMGEDTTKLESKKAKAVRQIEIKQAEAQRKSDLAQIQIDTAMAISRAMVDSPWWMKAVVAAIATANMVAQTATVNKQYDAKMASLGQFYDGGYTGDGRKYHRAVGVVHDGEFVANHNAVNNPSIRPVLDAIDYAQRNNTIASMTRDDVALAAGFANGGYTGTSGRPSDESSDVLRKLTVAVNQMLDSGIDANVYASGRSGIDHAMERRRILMANKSRN